jgi:hypothetical protein
LRSAALGQIVQRPYARRLGEMLIKAGVQGAALVLKEAWIQAAPSR